jgi:hypothetical protein
MIVSGAEVGATVGLIDGPFGLACGSVAGAIVGAGQILLDRFTIASHSAVIAARSRPYQLCR